MLAGSAWLGYEWRDRAADAELAALVADHATALAEAEAKARKAERDAALRVSQIAEQHEQDKRNAQIAADRTIADLRAGNVQLREHWRGCATDRVSQDAATAAELARQDELRRESLRRVLGWVGRLQAQRDALIDAYPNGR
jgi:hypothetical protein